ncbi:TrmH family RNA methyltransferase [Corynebacterium frankenforstense]
MSSRTPDHLDFSEPLTERTPRVVHAAKLHRAAARRKAGVFLAEGENSVEAAVATGAATDVFATEAAAGRFCDLLLAAVNLGVYLHPVTDRAAESLAETVTTTGIFAVCRPVTWPLKKALAAGPTLVSVPVETREPGNAGTLIRVADALGADAVVFAGDSVDPQGGKVVRASAGSLFHVPVVRERDPQAVIDSLRARGLQVLATAADGEVDLAAPPEPDFFTRPTAWLFGNEAHGLPAELQQAADHRVAIPIAGRAESLNLATAASICLWESTRAQRVHGVD